MPRTSLGIGCCTFELHYLCHRKGRRQKSAAFFYGLYLHEVKKDLEEKILQIFKIILCETNFSLCRPRTIAPLSAVLSRFSGQQVCGGVCDIAQIASGGTVTA